MNRFAPILKELNEKLHLPQPDKSRVLLEIAADMEDTYSYYLAHGKEDAQAVQLVREKFLVSDNALDELVNVHKGVFLRIMDKISRQAQSRWERGGLIIFLLAILVISGRIILSSNFFLQASPFIVPVMVITLFIFIITVVKFYTLFVVKNHAMNSLDKGLNELFLLGCACLIAGIFGYYIELYTFLNGMIAQSDFNFTVFFNWLLRTTPLMVYTLSVTFITGLLWFVLQNKVNSIRYNELNFLLSL